ncbi:MAG: diguanylate cyclase [Chitinispirillaceae bacterium]|nr:diguanylate cyclase [Chitinispirillaceae bacterium]
MKIRHAFNLFAVAVPLVLAFTVFVVQKSLFIHRSLVAIEQNRFHSYQLVMELFQSSENLTRMARSYVTTGNPDYKKRYTEILDIRKGTQPRPSRYTATYWHLAGAGSDPAIAPGEAIALLTLMRQAGFTEKEIGLLGISQANSDRLVVMEKKAFAALEGLFEDTIGNLTRRGTPDRELAVGLLFSDAYADEKTGIMAPLQECMDMLDARTRNTLVDLESELYWYIILSLVFALIALVSVGIIIVRLSKWILTPLEHLQTRLAHIARGDLTVRCHTVSKTEIGELCSRFNQMAFSLESDIKEREMAENALRRSEEKVRLLLDSTGEGICGIDPQGNATFANPACARMLGYPDPGGLLGRNIHLLMHHTYPDGRPMPVDACKMSRALRYGEGIHVDDEVLWRADGTSFPAEYRSYPQLVNGELVGAVITFSDITGRKQAEETILHMATHDALTDLPGLRLARDRLAMAISQAQRYKTSAAVMFVDLDGFKPINDTLGHDAGDEVLREVAQRLLAGVRGTDTVARIGGDEFLLVITELHVPENVSTIAEKILELLSRPLAIKNTTAHVGASIGIALFPRDAGDVEELLRLADETMYEVKRGGKNGYRFAQGAGQG